MDQSVKELNSIIATIVGIVGLLATIFLIFYVLWQGETIAGSNSEGNKRLNDFYYHRFSNAPVVYPHPSNDLSKSRCANYRRFFDVVQGFAKRSDVVSSIPDRLSNNPDLQEVKDYARKYGLWPLTCPPVYLNIRQRDGKMPGYFWTWKTSQIELLSTPDDCAADTVAIRDVLAKPKDIDAMIDDVRKNGRKILWSKNSMRAPIEAELSI
jgi:hypothetical protein